MNTIAILYIIAATGTNAAPAKVAMFDQMDRCKEAASWAGAHQEGFPVRFICVEYPSGTAGGWY